jgi:hypothetical protein
VDADLESYNSLRGSWPSLLIGNGASIAVCDRFRYDRLYDEAALTHSDRRVFEALETTNFESVLDTLRVARIVCRQHGHRSRDVQGQYRSIRQALFDALVDIHVAWSELATSTLKALRDTLRGHAAVYSTNYDLIAYWAIMSQDAKGFVDLFWGPDHTFDIVDASVSGNRTVIYYLHGSVHLYRRADGLAAKRVSDFDNLLDAAASDTSSIPLFVSEGQPDEKLAAIRRSDYLTFAFEEFSNDENPIVVFGHSLSDQDAHLRRALNRRGRRVAIGVLPNRSRVIVKQKADLLAVMPEARVQFFDATTHPLGQVSQLP